MFDIIVNPATGSGRGKKTFERIRPYLESAGVEYKVHFSDHARSIEKIVHDITSERSAEIIIIGGDGSMNEAVNGIVDLKKTRLGFIPAGSGNDLAKALGIPVIKKRTDTDRLEKLVSVIIEGKTRRLMDIGVCEVSGRMRLFNISSGTGFDAETSFQANRSRLKGVLNKVGSGKLIYILTALRLIIRNRQFACRIKTSDGRTRIYRKCFFAAVMNTRYEGGGFMFCPDADASDGLLDVCVAGGITPLKFILMFPKALSGKHVKYREIDVFRSESIEMTLSSPRLIHTDGEAEGKHRRVRFYIHPQKLRTL
ncbi:MAG: diacylglycerol kinase family lipid kinase [Lachnospiraceae bacterium]|nr:diacylglycerol kinase family lipid kinase [Lachnospiraceae bacterium]